MRDRAILINSNALRSTRGRKRVYLRRHGDVSYRHAHGRTVFCGEVSLPVEGINQARQMRELLVQVPCDVRVHTRLRPTRATVGRLLEGRKTRIEDVARLREIAVGAIGALSDERRVAKFTYRMARAAERGAAFPDGESFVAFQSRIVPAFEALLRRADSTTALVVAHGGTNAMIFASVMRGGLAGLLPFEQDAGCVNIIDADLVDGEIIQRMLRAANLTPYNLAKHERSLTVADRIVASHRDAHIRRSDESI